MHVFVNFSVIINFFISVYVIHNSCIVFSYRDFRLLFCFSLFLCWFILVLCHNNNNNNDNSNQYNFVPFLSNCVVLFILFLVFSFECLCVVFYI